MPKPPELTASPTFRETWQAAKKTADAMAKSAKRTKEFDAMTEEIGKLKFGPELDAWPGLYPDWPKMEAQKNKITVILTKYKKVVADGLKDVAAKKVDMPKDMLVKLQKALDEIESGLETQASLAKGAIESDPALGIKQSKEMAKSGGILTPIIVLQHPDVAPLIVKRLGDDAKIVAPKKLPVEVIVSDPNILSKMTETPDLRQKAQQEADFGKVLDDITLAYSTAAAEIKKKPDAANAQLAIVQKKVEEAVYAAAERGSKEIERITKVKSDYRKYQVKCAGEIALNVAALVGGVVSLATAPFTAGAGVILGCMSLAKGAVDLGTKLGKLALEAEDFAERLAGRFSTLLKRYEDEGSAMVGWRELGTTAMNAVFPTTFKTISECSGDAEQLGDKVKGIEVNAGSMSTELNEMLNDQEAFNKGLKKWEQDNTKVLEPKQVAAIEKLIKALDKNAEDVNKLIEKITVLNARVRTMRTRHTFLADAIKKLAAKEPAWAKFGEVFIKIVVAVGYTVSGTAVVPGPDAFNCVKEVKAISDIAGTVLGGISNAKDLYEGVKGLIKG